MKAQPLIKNKEGIWIRISEPSEATHIRLNFPGPFPTRIIPVRIKGTRGGTPEWTWNGDTEKPTLKPSVRTDDGRQFCHTYITDGKVIFLPDCTHEHAGKTMDLLDVED